MRKLSLWRQRPATLLARLIDAPDLVEQVRGLPRSAFSALVRQVGVEDTGELVALATTEQLVAAFDEDLFGNDAPGERERFDPDRFAIWLEVLLEAGDAAAAQRVSELSEDFVTAALSSLVLVLDHDSLLARLGEGDEPAVYADKALESGLVEELDGYLLVARKHEGWDAALALILALDQHHRDLLERILDHCAAVANPYVEDLDRLTAVLTEEESLAEDVEAEREDRRSRQGYVEARAARAFLTLAAQPPDEDMDAAHTPRDAITRAYFRELEPLPAAPAAPGSPGPSHTRDLLSAVALADAGAEPPALTAGDSSGDSSDGLDDDPSAPFTEAMRRLGQTDPERFTERLSELTYLANVLVAGAKVEDQRLTPAEATEAVLSTVTLGAELHCRRVRAASAPAVGRASADDLRKVLTTCSADLLFRVAAAALPASGSPVAARGFLRSAAELRQALSTLRPHG